MPCATASSCTTTAKDGLLSDNIGKIADDGESLWLSTTRGICRIAKSSCASSRAKQRSRLEPRELRRGGRAAQRAVRARPIPSAGGGDRTADGRLWFTTSRGLAVFDPAMRANRLALPPVVHWCEMTAERRTRWISAARRAWPRASERLQIRYTAIHLSAPERVQYFVQAGRPGYRLGARPAAAA